jgi:Mce-associated membrane protein
MSTTRHLINRRRRLAATAAPRERAAARPGSPGSPGSAGSPGSPGSPGSAARAGSPGSPGIPGGAADTSGDAPASTPGGAPRDTDGAGRAGRAATRSATAVRTRPARPPRPAADRAAGREPEGVDAPRRARPRPATVLIAALAVLTVLLGGLAAWSASRASDLRDSAATGNTALTDTARTSEVKGSIAQAVNAVFSYNYADAARTDDAAKRVLTGKAVQQYAAMLAEVRAQAPARKLVLTTTVTDTGVELLDGNRARVLVFADQSNTSTAKAASAASTYAAAMFAVDAVRQGGAWKIAAIDTFG